MRKPSHSDVRFAKFKSMVNFMSNASNAVLSIRYFLTLEESQDGFSLATFGQKPITRFLTPLISIALVAWGIYLGATDVGKYYVGLGGFFLLLQLLMRFYILPWLFKRQFVRHQFGQTEQGIDLYSDYAEFYASGRRKKVNYADIKQLIESKLTYMIELKSQTMVVVPKRALVDAAQQQIFIQAFKR